MRVKFDGVVRLNMGRFDTNEATLESGGLVNCSNCPLATIQDDIESKWIGAGGSHGGHGGNINMSDLG